MKVKSISECSILQYFWPALSDNGLENPFSVFLRVAVLHMSYCNSLYFSMKGLSWKKPKTNQRDSQDGLASVSIFIGPVKQNKISVKLQLFSYTSV